MPNANEVRCAWIKATADISEPADHIVEWRKTQGRVANGFVVFAWCLFCDKPAQSLRPVAHSRFTAEQLDAMPWVHAEGNKALCQVCKASAVLEEHRLAPRSVFGEEADRWPTVRVCHDCHLRWHEKMQPEMVERGRRIAALRREGVSRDLPHVP